MLTGYSATAWHKSRSVPVTTGHKTLVQRPDE